MAHWEDKTTASQVAKPGAEVTDGQHGLRSRSPAQALVGCSGACPEDILGGEAGVPCGFPPWASPDDKDPLGGRML